MNTKYKALVIDDEALACDMLEYLVKRHVPEIDQLKKCTSAVAGTEIIKTFAPDILFLDIQMPFLNGFEVLEKISSKNFSVIFTTAYNKYAIKALRFSALDYLLKPVDADELKAAVLRHSRKQENLQLSKLYDNFSHNVSSSKLSDYQLALRDAHGVKLVSPSSIIHCEAMNNYTKFYLADKSTLVTAKTIKEYEEILKDHHFIRIHKSHLVNGKFIKAITADYFVLLENGTQLELARKRKEDVMEFFKSREGG